MRDVTAKISFSLGLLLLLAACMREQPNVIVITATFLPEPETSAVVVSSTQVPPPLVLSPIADTPLTIPTLNPTRPAADIPSEHLVQAGDTLLGIAQRYSIPLEELIAANALVNPDILSVGQVIALPSVANVASPEFKIVPDSRLILGPGSQHFDTAEFINRQPGFIRQAVDEVPSRLDNGAEALQTLSAAQIVARVSLEYSVDPRLLLMLLEFRAGWLSNPQPREDLQTHPLISADIAVGVDRTGLYRQLAWAANNLNRGYYGYKFRGLATLGFDDGTRVIISTGLNAGTVGIQYLLSLAGATYNRWLAEVGPNGLYRLYASYFGDPFLNVVDPIAAPALTQPELILPFEQGVEWLYTGGPHGGWDSGSAWAALDFAPGEDREPGSAFCYTSDSWVVAVAAGLIVRSDNGAVVLDLDGDGNESTGWTIHYLHIASQDRVAAGANVVAGTRIGHVSCAGGFSNASHLHISRRFNGEWIPADCQACLPDSPRPTFVMSGWRAMGIAGQEYQGYMANGTRQIQAEQARETLIDNRISW